MYFLRSVKKCSHVLTPKCTQIYLLFNCVFPCFTVYMVSKYGAAVI